MDYSLISRLVLAACLWLAALPTFADEPAQPAPSQEAKAAENRYAEELSLLHSRISLDDQINRFALLDTDYTLQHANGLGIDVAAPDAALRAQLNLPDGQGLTVTQVPEDSVGAQAGLKVHDVIVEVDGRGVNEPAGLGKLLEVADGKTVKLRLWRAGKPTDLEAKPKKPEYARLKLRFADLDRGVLATAESYRIGVTLSEADDTLRQQLRLAAGEGLVVTEVVADSAAAQAGIQVNDVLTMLDGKRLTTVEAINAQIQELKDKAVELRLVRSGKEVTMQIAARKTEEAAFSNQPLVFWNTKFCQDCHVVDKAHQGTAKWLGANYSAWTDGHHSKLWLYEKAFRAQTEAAAQEAPSASAPAQQIETLKSQLAEMQKTLAALEQSLQPTAEPAKNESPEEKSEPKK